MSTTTNSASLTHRIYDETRQAILNLDYLPGSKLSEAKTATQFGCSRVPVRDAFKQLCLEGFLENKPQVGTFVTLINMVQLEQIRYVRECLETQVMQDGMTQGLFSSNITQLQSMVDTQAELYHRGQYEEMHHNDKYFHALFFRLADKEFVSTHMGTGNPHYERARLIAVKYDNRPERLIEQHQAIIDAIIAKDCNRLRQAMSAHLNNLYRVLSLCPDEIQCYFTSEA